MKNLWQKLLVIPLILAVAAASVYGQADNGANATRLSAQTPSALPPISDIQDEAETNGAMAGKKNVQEPDDHFPVRIDRTGVHVGADSSVNVGFGPNGGGPAAAIVSPEAEGIPIGVVLLGLAGIVAPLVFVVALLGGIFYFKHRRNRMLHETLRQMIDKGVPIPPELILPPGQLPRRGNYGDFRSGMVILAVGLGIVLFLSRFGWIVVFVGAAFLITWFMEKKDTTSSNAATLK